MAVHGVLLTAVLSVGLSNVGSSTADTCEPFQLKKENLNIRLNGHALIQMKVTGHHECARECMVLTACKSIDYFNKTCTLNDADSQTADHANYESQAGAIYSDISEWPSIMVRSCSTRPCAHTQKCIVAGEQYKCINIDCGDPKIKHGAPGLTYIGQHTTVCEQGYFVNGTASITCMANGTWGQKPECQFDLSDCHVLLQHIPSATSGIYLVKQDTLYVYCDMDTDGGGWTVFQNRMNGLVDFYRNFTEYENGFGVLEGEFWLGLRYIHQMTSQVATELRIVMTAADDSMGFDNYADFNLSVGTDYIFNIGLRTSTDGLEGEKTVLKNNGYRFSTYDKDQDIYATNCAENSHGAWWYPGCGPVNLNGEYLTPGSRSSTFNGWAGMLYYAFRGKKSLKTTKMMFRRL